MEGYDDDAWMGGPDNPSRRANGKCTKHRADVAATVAPAASPATAVTPADSPSPPPVPETAAAVKEKVPEEIISPEQRARHFRKVSGGVYMGNIIGAVMGGLDDPEMMSCLLDDLARECNAHADPTQRFLIEQICLMHHSIAALHCSAASAKSPQISIQYSMAAARLLGEMRKFILARQQLQTVSLCDATFLKMSKSQVKKIAADQKEFVTELRGNGTSKTECDQPDGQHKSRKTNGQEPKTRTGRSRESDEVSGLDDNRAAKASDVHQNSPAVATINGTPHKRW